MTELVQSSRSTFMRRMALAGVGAFLAVVLAATLVLWAKLGTAVFFEAIRAGIAYCL